MTVFTRAWCMPNHNTFAMGPVVALLDRVLAGRSSVVDPFARGSTRAHWSNDLSPDFCANPMEAQDFLRLLEAQNVTADALLLDPPYSPRQMSESYKAVGLDKGMEGSQNARLYSQCKDLMTKVAADDAVAITFGWNSSGFGEKRGWELQEILMLCHGAAHNDTIVTVERKVKASQAELLWSAP